MIQPEDKAKKIVDLYIKAIDESDLTASYMYELEEETKKTAIKCAKIAVDGMIVLTHNYVCRYYNFSEEERYWREVKEHLNKMR